MVDTCELHGVEKECGCHPAWRRWHKNVAGFMVLLALEQQQPILQSGKDRRAPHDHFESNQSADSASLI